MLGSRSSPALVGRIREMEELAGGLAGAASRSGSFFLISGEPGIGKTRLLVEFAAQAAERGFRVVWARSWEGGGAPPYWPWLQILRSQIREGGLASLTGLVREAPQVAQLLPELPPDEVSSQHQPVDTDAARFRMFDGITRVVRDAAESTPLVLLFEDVHWADLPSLLLLEFLAGSLVDMPVVVAATYREFEVRRGDERADALARIARHARHFPLRGLALDEVAALLREHGLDVREPTAREIHRTTDGNPYFVDELVRLLVAEGALGAAPSGQLPVPATVRDAIRARTAHLSSAAVDVLRIAAVVGRDVQLGILKEATGRPMDELLVALGEAVDAGFLSAASPALGTYTFAHALVRESLYEDISVDERAALHLQVGRGLERFFGPAVDRHLAETAHHFLGAAALEPLLAAQYALGASRQAIGQLASEEAASFCRRALDVLPPGAETPGLRCDLVLALGEAELRSGRYAAAIEAFRQAASIAEAERDSGRLARAAVGLDDAVAESGDFVLLPESLGLLSQTSALVGGSDPAVRSMLLGRLARALHFFSGPAETIPMAREALALAEELGDGPLICSALQGLWWSLWSAEDLSERAEVSRRLITVAQEAGSEALGLWGRVCRIQDLFERGDMAAAEAATQELERLLTRLPLPQWVYVPPTLRAMRSMREGRLDEALGAAEELERVMVARQSEGTATVRAWLRLLLARERGEREAMEAGLDDVLRYVGFHPLAAAAARLLVLTELGSTEDIEPVVGTLGPETVAEVPPGLAWLAVVSILTAGCERCGRSELCEQLYGALLPYRGRLVAVGFVFQLGAVSHWLALAASGAGREREARELFQEAIEHHDRIGARLWAARSRYEYARWLTARGEDEPAREHAAHALADAERTGAVLIAERCRDLVGGPPSAQPATIRGVFRRTAEGWLVALGGDPVVLPDSKGLRAIAMLLGAPQRELHALELIGLVEGHAPARVTVSEELYAEGDLGPAVDPAARDAYRTRLAELNEDIEQAREWNDLERAAKLEEEKHALLAQLTRGFGLGGRQRPQGSQAERARVNMTKVVRRAIRAVAGTDPLLARHLERTVRTGTFFTYMPDPLEPVDWSL